MKKTIVLVLLLVSFQATVWAGSHSVIITLRPGARLSPALAAMGATAVDSMPGTNSYLVNVPSLAMLQNHSNPDIESVEMNSAVQIHPRSVSIGILKTSGSQAPEWYAKQPAIRLIRASAAHAYSRGRGIVIADINRVDYGHPALRGYLTTGHDFVSERTSQSASLNQSSAGFWNDRRLVFSQECRRSCHQGAYLGGLLRDFVRHVI